MHLVQSLVSLVQPSPHSNFDARPVSSMGMINDSLRVIELNLKATEAKLEGKIWAITRNEQRFEFHGPRELRTAFEQAVRKGTNRPEGVYNFQTDLRSADLLVQAVINYVKRIDLALMYAVQPPELKFELPKTIKAQAAQQPLLNLVEAGITAAAQSATKPLHNYYRHVSSEAAYFWMLAGPHGTC